jgi:hypothetical protein
MHWRAIAAQHGLPHAVEIDDDRHHLVALAGAGRDGLADQLVGERGRDLWIVDQALCLRTDGCERNRSGQHAVFPY